MMSTLRNYLVPRDGFGRVLLLLNLGFGVAFYLWLGGWVGSNGYGVIIDALVLLGVFICLSLLSLVYLIGKKHLVSFSFLVLGIAAVFALPSPPSREERAFAAHRAEYEELVELARQGQFTPGSSDECGMPNEFPVPAEYKRVIATHCMFARNRESLRIEITPIWYDSLIYFENKLTVGSSCGWGSRDYIEKQLDEHWFLCNKDPG